MTFKWIIMLGIVMALTLVGWGDIPMKAAWAASDESEVVQSESDEDSGESLDDLFAEVARMVPGFGGLSIGPNGTLHIGLLDRRLGRAAKGAIETIFGPERFPLGKVRVIQRKYSFLQLKDWHERMMPEVLGLPGVSFTDIDEAENRLRVGIERQELLGIERQELQGSVEVQLASLDIPREAVLIEETEPIELMSHTLSSFVRPLEGGLQINFSNFLCTLGFIAIRAGVQGFVTNSHCTNIQGGIQSTVYHQPIASGTTNRIAMETADPSYFTGGACPAGRRCRYSDSAFARVPHPSGPSVTVSRGFIARPTTVNTGALTISHTTPRFRIVGETSRPVVGETLNKVGRTTGWTQGTVSATCVNTNVSGTTITQLCQDFVNAGVAGGDSGSPVFRVTSGGSDVRLYGVLWGSSGGARFVFSAIGSVNIQRSTELGPLTTCAPGFSC